MCVAGLTVCRRRASLSALICAAVALCLPHGLSTRYAAAQMPATSFIGLPPWHGTYLRQTLGRNGAVARPAEDEYKPFSADKLRAESEDPFAKVRIVLFGFGAVSALVGFVLTLPRLAGSMLGAPNAAPVATVAQDIALNVGGSALCAFLASQELRTEGARERQREEGALIARLTVSLHGAGGPTLVRLSDLREFRGGRARRPVLCIGGLEFCLACVESSAKVIEAIDKADLLLVPVLSTDEDRMRLIDAASGLDHVALPPAGSSDWATMCSVQTEKVRSQGMDETRGQVVVIKKNGRVATRFLGVPNWPLIAGGMDTRIAVGLDSTNI